MSMPERLSNYLDQRGARYELHAHEPSHSSAETARMAHVLPHSLAKSVLLEDDDGAVMAVVPADKVVQIGQLARLLGRRQLHLADEDRVAELFADCERGAVPPVGMAWGIETIVDDELEANDVVYMECGDHQCLLSMPHEQFHALMGDARHGQICARPHH
ncbi:aminoacyl-tRNA deacylase [Piscinibacter sakaiensis]|uniref:aminoacyl-tRNA deacylase n=1 Tax=Piscinibacter sakaiensis TaxID=1547922 RepID=UPI003AAD0F82